jgi:hypothetical protein
MLTMTTRSGRSQHYRIAYGKIFDTSYTDFHDITGIFVPKGHRQMEFRVTAPKGLEIGTTG